MWKGAFEGVKLPVSEADNPLAAKIILVMLHLYTVIAHLYPEGLSVNAEEFCRFINLEVKMVESLFYVFFFYIYQGHPSGRRINHRSLFLIDLAIVKYVREIDDRVVAQHT